MKKYEDAFGDYQKGLKYKEIAEKYGVSISTVKSWKSRYWPQEKVATSRPEDILLNNIMIQYTANIRAQKIMYVSSNDDLSEQVSKWSSSESGSSEEYAIRYAWKNRLTF